MSWAGDSLAKLKAPRAGELASPLGWDDEFMNLHRSGSSQNLILVSSLAAPPLSL